MKTSWVWTMHFYESDFDKARLLKSLAKCLDIYWGMAVRYYDEDDHLLIKNVEITFYDHPNRSVKDSHKLPPMLYVPVPGMYSLVDLFLTEREDTWRTPPHNKGLVYIQVNKLKDGFCLAVGINHVLADWATHIHFTRTWSEFYQADKEGKPPKVYKPRDFGRDYWDLSSHEEVIKECKKIGNDYGYKFIKKKQDFADAPPAFYDQMNNFPVHFTKKFIKELKEYAMKVAEPKVDYVTSYEVVSVHVQRLWWLYNNFDPTKDKLMVQPVINCRNRAIKVPAEGEGNMLAAPPNVYEKFPLKSLNYGHMISQFHNGMASFKNDNKKMQFLVDFLNSKKHY
eukprot:UN06564